MKIEVDARGLDCPKPVIQTKKAIESAGVKNVLAIVDNKTAKENISKLATSLNCNFTVEEIGADFYIEIYKGEILSKEIMPEKKPSIHEIVIVVGKDKLGDGNDELGEVLMNGYFYTLTEVQPYPKAILFLNSGVNLTIEGSKVLEHLRILESLGVEILSCGTCLDYYMAKDKLAVGGVSNMFTIVEHMNKAKNTIRI
ncbi:MAG: sulfurtransferase-like selenium metabolism protein YedF [Acidaminobacteraceae bacterium]